MLKTVSTQLALASDTLSEILAKGNTSGPNNIIMDSGSGIYIGGTAAANLLDDYEEGTWTPSLGGDATYTIQIGNYTKIGNLVTIRGVVTVNVLGTGSTTVLSGLPFANSGTDNFTGSVCTYFSGIVASLSVLIASADIGATSVKFTGQASPATTMTVPTVFASGSRVDFAFSYEV